MLWDMLLLCAYGFGTASFFAVTFLEGRGHGDGWNLRRIAGLSLSLFWPAVLLVLFMLARLAPRGANPLPVSSRTNGR
ncbi:MULTISPECIES: hypothetical protein [unclassified Sinorhizobium]|uniref:hypothetical protein n=1 Tax=unclassified Sinorhizobium TaxID=2613772 RepID=UPI00352329D6